jgi:hypothetical protein
MNVEIGTVAAKYLFWKHLFRIFGIGSMQFHACLHILDENEIVSYFILIKNDIELPGRFRIVGIDSLQCMLINVFVMDENYIVF